MRDILTEASPFTITKEGKIQYETQFKNPEYYRPQFAHIENPDKLKELTTAEDLGSSSIKVILESESWRFISTKVKIGIYTSDPKEYNVKITEIKDADMLPPEI
jgi:hypothetical protein